MCEVPTQLAAGNITLNTADLSWAAVTGANRYKIGYRAVNSSYWSVVYSNTNSVTLTDLNTSTEYLFYVQTECNQASSQRSDYAYFITNSGCPSPANLSAHGITPYTANLAWNPVGGATQYEVAYRKNSSGHSWQTVTASNNYTSLSGLDEETQYRYKVRAYCSTQGGWTIYSTLAYFTTQSDCQAPGALAAKPASTSAVLSWKEVYGANGYQVQYKPLSARNWTETSTYSDEVTVYELKPATDYVFRVIPNCLVATEQVVASKEYPFTTTQGSFSEIGVARLRGGLLAGTEPASGFWAEAYPNPNQTGVVTLAMENQEAGKLKVILLDQAGREISSLIDQTVEVGTHSHTLTLPEVKPGMYMLRISQGQHLQTLMLAIQ